MSLMKSENSCQGNIRDCVGKVGDCPVVISVEDCFNFVRDENTSVKDCVGKVGDCPVVTAVEDCTTYIRQDISSLIKEFDDVSLEDPEVLFPPPVTTQTQDLAAKKCNCGNCNPLKAKVDSIIQQLIAIHNSL